MALTNAGRDFIAQAIVNASSPTFFDASNAYIGVGDSNTAFAAGQTDLQAASNKLRKGMDGSYPQRSANQLTFRSTFGTSEANFAWEEWAIFNASSSGVMLSRKVEALGTKTSAQSWQITCTITVNAA